MKRPIAVYASSYGHDMSLAHNGHPEDIERALGIKVPHNAYEHHRLSADTPGACAAMLQENFGISATEIVQAGTALDDHDGYILILSGDCDHPPSGQSLKRLAVFRAMPRGTDPESPPAKPPRAKKSDAQISGMVATGALVFMLGFMGLLFWMS